MKLDDMPTYRCRCGREVKFITTHKGFEMCLWCYATIYENELAVPVAKGEAE